MQARPRSPVVLVGGIGQKTSSWDPWIADLNRLGVPWTIADVPNKGYAPQSGYLDAIEGARRQVLSTAGLPSDTPVSLIGFSNGGVAAVRYLRLHPHLVDRVVTVSSPLRGNEVATIATGLFRSFTPKWIQDITVRDNVLDGMDPELGQRITSFTGAVVDGIVTARSGTSALVNVVRCKELGVRGKVHPQMQTNTPELRRAAFETLA